jgi:hypothetical protein
MTPAKAKRAGRSARKGAAKEKEVKAYDEDNPLASVPGEEPPPSASTRARNAIPGTEIETASGPQEVGPTRGARRPYSAERGASRAPVVIPPIRGDEETREAIDEVREKQEKTRAARAKGRSVPVIATRMGYYDHKRRRVGDLFYMAAGEPLPSWVVKAEKGDTREEVELKEVREEAAEPREGDEVL